MDKTFVDKNGIEITDVKQSSCGRFIYSQAESMKEYGLTELQYNFYTK